MKPVRSVSASRPHVDWLDGPIASLDVNRRLFATLLVEHLPSVGYRMPQATYLAWLDFCGLGWVGVTIPQCTYSITRESD